MNEKLSHCRECPGDVTAKSSYCCNECHKLGQGLGDGITSCMQCARLLNVYSFRRQRMLGSSKFVFDWSIGGGPNQLATLQLSNGDYAEVIFEEDVVGHEAGIWYGPDSRDGEEPDVVRTGFSSLEAGIDWIENILTRRQARKKIAVDAIIEIECPVCHSDHTQADNLKFPTPHSLGGYYTCIDCGYYWKPRFDSGDPAKTARKRKKSHLDNEGPAPFMVDGETITAEEIDETVGGLAALVDKLKWQTGNYAGKKTATQRMTYDEFISSVGEEGYWVKSMLEDAGLDPRVDDIDYVKASELLKEDSPTGEWKKFIKEQGDKNPQDPNADVGNYSDDQFRQSKKTAAGSEDWYDTNFDDEDSYAPGDVVRTCARCRGTGEIRGIYGEEPCPLCFGEGVMRLGKKKVAAFGVQYIKWTRGTPSETKVKDFPTKEARDKWIAKQEEEGDIEVLSYADSGNGMLASKKTAAALRVGDRVSKADLKPGYDWNQRDEKNRTMLPSNSDYEVSGQGTIIAIEKEDSGARNAWKLYTVQWDDGSITDNHLKGDFWQGSKKTAIGYLPNMPYDDDLENYIGIAQDADWKSEADLAEEYSDWYILSAKDAAKKHGLDWPPYIDSPEFIALNYETYASKKTAAGSPLSNQLKALLSDAMSLYFKAHAAHWNVTGSDFSQFHEMFAAIYEDVYDSIDPIAENIRKLDDYAPQDIADLEEMRQITPLSVTSDVPTLVADLLSNNEAYLATLTETFTVANEMNQQGIANFIAERIDSHQKWSWQLKSSLPSPSIAEARRRFR